MVNSAGIRVKVSITLRPTPGECVLQPSILLLLPLDVEPLGHQSLGDGPTLTKQEGLENFDVSQSPDILHTHRRVGLLFNHAQISIGICGRRDSMDAISNSMPTTHWPVTSVYRTVEIAVAHLTIACPSHDPSSQST